VLPMVVMSMARLRRWRGVFGDAVEEGLALGLDLAGELTPTAGRSSWESGSRSPLSLQGV
jgi:hypothetical protein